jgi:type III secretory pathway component EscU
MEEIFFIKSLKNIATIDAVFEPIYKSYNKVKIVQLLFYICEYKYVKWKK